MLPHDCCHKPSANGDGKFMALDLPRLRRSEILWSPLRHAPFLGGRLVEAPGGETYGRAGQSILNGSIDQKQSRS